MVQQRLIVQRKLQHVTGGRSSPAGSPVPSADSSIQRWPRAFVCECPFTRTSDMALLTITRWPSMRKTITQARAGHSRHRRDVREGEEVSQVAYAWFAQAGQRVLIQGAAVAGFSAQRIVEGCLAGGR